MDRPKIQIETPSPHPLPLADSADSASSANSAAAGYARIAGLVQTPSDFLDQ